MNTIAIIGGNGKAGQYLVRELIKQGYSVKLLLRNPEYFPIKDPLIQIVPGNILDHNSVLSLLKGTQAVISTLGQRKGEPIVFSRASTNIIQAMKACSIKRYILVTGMNLTTPNDKKSTRNKLLSFMMKLFFPSIVRDRQLEYELLEHSTIDWTIVRLPMIELADSRGAVKADLYDCPGGKISAGDLAEFLIDQIKDAKFVRKAPFISN